MICIMARQMGVAGIIRVPWNAPTDIKKPFDVGAVGIIVPQIDTPDEASDAVRFARFPPLGERSIAPWFAGPMGVDPAEIMINNNTETVVILQMESLEAYENIDEILKVDGFDVVLAGPTDLSASLGIPGQIHHSKVENIMVDLAQKVKGTGKTLATTYGDPEDCKRWIKEGYRMMNVSSPLILGTVNLKRIFEEFREELG